MEAKAEKVLAAGAGDMRPAADEARGAKRKTSSRARLAPEAWAAAEKAYLGGAPAAEVSALFGMSVQTIYSRMGGRGKRAQARQRVAQREEQREEHTGALALTSGQLAAFADAVARVLHRLCGRLDPVMRAIVLMVLEQWEATAPHEERQALRSGGVRVRRHHAAAVWKAARRDYEEGDFTAPEVAERYGMTLHAVKRRARVERWSKTVIEPPRPLMPPDDPAQVDADGKSNWAQVAHAAQLPPEGAWSTWLFQGGRGAGKTRAGAEWLAARAEATPDGRFALVAPTEHDLREVMIEGASGLRALPGRETPKYEPSRRRLRWNNGAVAYGFSAEEPERLRGPQFAAAWADEFCAWKHAEAVLANLRLGLRLGADPRLVVTTTPRPVRALRKLREETTCVMTQAATHTNAANLSAGFVAAVEAVYGGTRLAEQELGGVLVDGDGALWKAEWIARWRGAAPTMLERLVVAVDPPAGLDGSACGIVVAGLSGGRAYVLADRSVHGLSPLGWGTKVKEAAEEFGALLIVAEANQGGEMVRHTLQTAGVACSLKMVRATQGKAARALPVSALYEKGLVTHCGTFVELEEELMALGPAETEGGFDRADALVWALGELMLEKQPRVPRIWVP